MTDLETTLRRGLTALADDVRPEVPELVQARRRRRRPATAGLLLAGTIALTGTAAALGAMPTAVEERFEEAIGWGNTPDLVAADARIVATASLDGTTYEYWVAEGPDGGRCEYLRQVRAGEPENGSRACMD